MGLTSVARKAHTDVVHPYHCNDCQESFRTRNLFDTHENTHHNLKCLPCGKVFRSHNALEQHALSPAHPFQCKKCRRGYLFEATLQRHIAENHTWTCDKCQETFEGPKHLEMHKKFEHDNKKCSECEACHNCHPGTIDIPFMPFSIKETPNSDIKIVLQSITCRGSHQKLSFEELRLADYDQSLRYKIDGSPGSGENTHRLQCPKCPKYFKNVSELFQHASDHISIPEKSAAVLQNNSSKGKFNLEDQSLTNNSLAGYKLQLKCLKSGCYHQSSTLNAFRHHYHTCNMAKCDACDGFFDKGEDPELKSHKAKVHAPRPIFGCVQCTRTFESPEATAKHYSAEHAFVCEACPGIFFISSAIRDSHITSCNIWARTSDSGESFQTSRTEFSPVMQRKSLPAIKVPAQPLIQIHDEPKIEKTRTADQLAQTILEEANANANENVPPRPMFKCRECDAPPFEIKEEFDRHMKYSPFHGPPQLTCYECHITYQTQLALFAHIESKVHSVKWVLSIISTD
ncbi:hypothetical protein NHQ30_009629 [Ciborinia camelliae]|nr:hypothetical protein NHQ30_009629 [Ciborinia camelliae]